MATHFPYEFPPEFRRFEPVAKAVPDYNTLMSGSGAALGGRTGEIFALRSELRTASGAGHLSKELVKHGVPPEKLAAFAGAFLGHIQDSAGAEAVGEHDPFCRNRANEGISGAVRQQS